MNKLMKMYADYEGTFVEGSGCIDTVRLIVTTISKVLFENSSYKNKFCISDFSLYSFIKKIYIKRNHCFIKYVDDSNDVCNISFSCIFFDNKYFNHRFSMSNFKSSCINEKEYIFSRMCHDVTLNYLIENKKNHNIYSITSLCVSNSNLLFYHSYIWDKGNNMIYDFARNICMNKDDFDLLFLYREINVLDYTDYCNYYKKEYDSSDNFCPLYYLALVTLCNERKSKGFFKKFFS